MSDDSGEHAAWSAGFNGLSRSITDPNYASFRHGQVMRDTVHGTNDSGMFVSHPNPNVSSTPVVVGPIGLGGLAMLLGSIVAFCVIILLFVFSGDIVRSYQRNSRSSAEADYKSNLEKIKVASFADGQRASDIMTILGPGRSKDSPPLNPVVMLGASANFIGLSNECGISASVLGSDGAMCLVDGKRTALTTYTNMMPDLPSFIRGRPNQFNENGVPLDKDGHAMMIVAGANEGDGQLLEIWLTSFEPSYADKMAASASRFLSEFTSNHDANDIEKSLKVLDSATSKFSGGEYTYFHTTWMDGNPALHLRKCYVNYAMESPKGLQRVPVGGIKADAWASFTIACFPDPS